MTFIKIGDKLRRGSETITLTEFRVAVDIGGVGMAEVILLREDAEGNSWWHVGPAGGLWEWLVDNGWEVMTDDDTTTTQQSGRSLLTE